jgi:hypothetical protein
MPVVHVQDFLSKTVDSEKLKNSHLDGAEKWIFLLILSNAGQEQAIVNGGLK